MAAHAHGAERSRRRRWVVNRPLQFRFVNAMVVILCAMAVLAVAAVYVGGWLTLSSFELTGNLLMVSLLQTMCWTIVLELLAVTPLVIWWGVRLSHRVAGPLVRIHAALARMANGQYDVQVKLRAGDELTELADAINVLAASLHNRSRA
ncbi:MAG: HAMP domain-containing protein [Candidatus Omnitrophica bacterium]|nr:HAMP domain-containing protein [Candidatus Omnitrophota bacterium]